MDDEWQADGVDVPPHPSPLLPLTLTLLLAHDSVTEREQAEKLVSVQVPDFHWLQQGVVIETEVRICQGVEGSEVQSLKTNTGSGTITGSAYGTYVHVSGCRWMCSRCLDYWPLVEVPVGLWLHLTDTNRWMRLLHQHLLVSDLNCHISDRFDSHSIYGIAARVCVCVCVTHPCLFALTVSLSIDGAFIEAHDVLCQSASLITEYVFNLRETQNTTFILECMYHYCIDNGVGTVSVIYHSHTHTVLLTWPSSSFRVVVLASAGVLHCEQNICWSQFIK